MLKFYSFEQVVRYAQSIGNVAFGFLYETQWSEPMRYEFTGSDIRRVK